MSEQSCFHCGLTIAKNEEINFDEKSFVVTDVRPFTKFLVFMI